MRFAAVSERRGVNTPVANPASAPPAHNEPLIYRLLHAFPIVIQRLNRDLPDTRGKTDPLDTNILTTFLKSYFVHSKNKLRAV